MPESPFTDLPILGDLGRELDAAMARAVAGPEQATPATPTPVRRLWRRRGRPLSTLVVAILLGALGTSTAAAMLTVLRGSPIPIPRTIDVQPPMRPQIGTGTLLPPRAERPGGGDAFALRRSRSATGLTCTTVGQVRDGRFGALGTDDVFRDLPSEIVDGCGLLTGPTPSIMGARVFDAPQAIDVRSVLYGLAGPTLRSASVRVRGRWRALPTAGGAFVLAVAGYPEDSGLTVRLTYAGGRTTTTPIGTGYSTVVDPTGPAWTAYLGQLAGRDPRPCLYVGLARPSETTPQAPRICGRQHAGRTPAERPLDRVYFSARTLRPGDHGPQLSDPRRSWDWHESPARTLVYGYAERSSVRQIRLLGQPAARQPTRLQSGAFLAVLPASVAAADVAVELTFADGTRVVRRRALGLSPSRREVRR